MNTRAFGPTGARVHPVGLGCMSLSGFYGPSSETEAMRVLAAALDLGVDFWDTANVYGEGLSETRLGAFFAEDRGPARKSHARHQVQHQPRAGREALHRQQRSAYD